MASDSGSGQASVAQIKKVLYKAVEDHLIRAELADDDGPYLACEYEAVARRIAALASAPAVLQIPPELAKHYRDCDTCWWNIETGYLEACSEGQRLILDSREGTAHTPLKGAGPAVAPPENASSLSVQSAPAVDRAGVLEEARLLRELAIRNAALEEAVETIIETIGDWGGPYDYSTFSKKTSDVIEAIRALKGGAAMPENPGYKQQSGEHRADSKQTSADAGKELRASVRKLLSKLDQVDNDTAGIFELAHIHGQGYKGANWREEYDAGLALLSEGEK